MEKNKKRIACEDYDYTKRPYPKADQGFNDCVASAHQVTIDADWNSMINNFFQGNPIMYSDPIALMSIPFPVDPNTELWKVEFNLDPTDNIFTHSPEAWNQKTDPKPADGLTYWSFFVLLSLRSNPNVAYIKLVKLKEASSTLIAAGIVAFDSNNQVRWHGDLTSQLPIIEKPHISNLP